MRGRGRGTVTFSGCRASPSSRVAACLAKATHRNLLVHDACPPSATSRTNSEGSLPVQRPHRGDQQPELDVSGSCFRGTLRQTCRKVPASPAAHTLPTIPAPGGPPCDSARWSRAWPMP